MNHGSNYETFKKCFPLILVLTSFSVCKQVVYLEAWILPKARLF